MKQNYLQQKNYSRVLNSFSPFVSIFGHLVLRRSQPLSLLSGSVYSALSSSTLGIIIQPSLLALKGTVQQERLCRSYPGAHFTSICVHVQVQVGLYMPKAVASKHRLSVQVLSVSPHNISVTLDVEWTVCKPSIICPRYNPVPFESPLVHQDPSGFISLFTTHSHSSHLHRCAQPLESIQVFINKANSIESRRPTLLPSQLLFTRLC